MNTRTAQPPFQPGHGDEFIPERGYDAYKAHQKLKEPTACPTCGAVYHAGRWQWLARPAGAAEVICPACHRTADRMPAGYVYIEGEFAIAHRDEVLRLLRNHEQRARTEHPLERIMAVENEAGRTVVTTTDLHLARDLGSALKAAFHGTLDLKYSKDENLLRAYWRR